MTPTPAEHREHTAYQRRLVAAGVIPPERVTMERLLDLVFACERLYQRSVTNADLRYDHKRARAKLVEEIERYRAQGRDVGGR